MVRTTLGAEVETTVTVSGSESVDYLNLDQTSDIPDADSQTTIVRPPSGSVYELLAIILVSTPPSTADSGLHEIQMKSETAEIPLLFMRSDHTTLVRYRRGNINRANLVQQPANDQILIQLLQGLRFDEDNGLEITVSNELNTVQTETREIRLWVREIQVAPP